MQIKNKIFSEVFTKWTIELKIVTFLAAQSLDESASNNIWLRICHLYSISIEELGQPNILVSLFFLIICQMINLLAISRWDTISIDASTTFSWNEGIIQYSRASLVRYPYKC